MKTDFHENFPFSPILEFKNRPRCASTIISIICSGYNTHTNYGMIGQSEYSTANNYGGYGPATSAYQIGSNTNALSNGIGITTLPNTINPYASSVIGSSNGYSKVLSLAGGSMASVSSCYPLSSAQHLQSDKNGPKDRLGIFFSRIFSLKCHFPRQPCRISTKIY